MAFNALALRPGGSGVQTYIRELLKALAPQTTARLVAHVQRDAVAELPPTVDAVPRAVSHGAHRAVQGLLPLGAADLYHGLDVDIPLALPPRWPGRRRPHRPTVVTVHDLAVFDAPWAFGRGRLRGEQVLYRRAIGRADAIVAVSAFTAERVAARFGREAVVTELAPDPRFAPVDAAACTALRARLDLPERFVVQVATIEPRKDVALLAAACREVNVPLLLAGAKAPGSEVPAGARHLGYVAPDDLAALYGAATIVAYISRYEGFGLPPVEAMASGAAVVASRVGGLPDVVGDGAFLVDGGDLDGLVAALADLLADEAHRRELRERAVRAAARLSWAQTAATTRSVYRDLGVAA